MTDEIALIIGRRILEQYEQWTKNPKGKSVRIPVKLPQKFGHPDWAMTIECDMPRFVEGYFENGEYKTKHWSLKEWYEATKDE